MEVVGEGRRVRFNVGGDFCFEPGDLIQVDVRDINCALVWSPYVEWVLDAVVPNKVREFPVRRVVVLGVVAWEGGAASAAPADWVVVEPGRGR